MSQKQVMPKSEDLSRSLEINAIWTFDTEFPTIFNKSCTYITFKSAVKHRQLGYGYPRVYMCVCLFVCVCACVRACVYSIIMTNVVNATRHRHSCVIMLTCIDKPFLNGKIHFIITKLSFEKLPEDYS